MQHNMLLVAASFALWLSISSTQGGVAHHNPFYCYADDPIRQWTGLGGMHSIYEPNRGQNINANVSTCNPSKFWMLGRFGSRLPTCEELVEIIPFINGLHRQILMNYAQGKTSLCASDIELLKNWQFNPNVTLEVAENLAPSGWNELKALAKRYQVAFPTILPSTYSPNDYFFRSTNYHRSIHSLYAFADGLFGPNAHENVRFEDIPEVDVLLLPYYSCSLFQDLAPLQMAEEYEFMEGAEYQEMVVQVSARLGFHNSNVLRNSEVTLLILHCQYEQMWNFHYTDPSPFCAAFSASNAQVIEYSKELFWYYRIGYGIPEYRKLYNNIICFLLQDLLRFIQSDDNNGQKARIFNGHVTQFIILLHFDAFEGDDILTRHNFAQQTNRVWRANENLPMAANLAVIKFDCADDDNDILFLFNEKPLQIRGCDSNGVCKQSLILERLNPYLNANCMEIFCTNS